MTAENFQAQGRMTGTPQGPKAKATSRGFLSEGGIYGYFRELIHCDSY